MGMFDSVMLPCPKCGALNEAQSKGGDCTLAVYRPDNAPLAVLSDVRRHAPFECNDCGVTFDVHVQAGRRPRTLFNRR